MDGSILEGLAQLTPQPPSATIPEWAIPLQRQRELEMNWLALTLEGPWGVVNIPTWMIGLFAAFLCFVIGVAYRKRKPLPDAKYGTQREGNRADRKSVV